VGRTKNTKGGILLNNIFTYRDTAELLGIGLLIILISWAGSLFLSGISILLVGVYISFGNRMNKINDQFIKADRKNKEINDGKN
jgi:hypothetical protein